MSTTQRNDTQKQWNPSTKVGLSIDVDLKEHFSLETGLYYNLKKYTETAWKFSNEYAEWFDNISKKRHFLQVPIIAKYKFSINHNTKFFVGAGPYVAICLKNKIENEPYYITTEYEGDDWWKFYNNYNTPIGVNENGISNEFLL